MVKQHPRVRDTTQVPPYPQSLRGMTMPQGTHSYPCRGFLLTLTAACPSVSVAKNCCTRRDWAKDLFIDCCARVWVFWGSLAKFSSASRATFEIFYQRCEWSDRNITRARRC